VLDKIGQNESKSIKISQHTFDVICINANIILHYTNIEKVEAILTQYTFDIIYYV